MCGDSHLPASALDVESGGKRRTSKLPTSFGRQSAATVSAPKTSICCSFVAATAPLHDEQPSAICCGERAIAWLRLWPPMLLFLLQMWCRATACGCSPALAHNPQRLARLLP